MFGRKGNTASFGEWPAFLNFGRSSGPKTTGVLQTSNQRSVEPSKRARLSRPNKSPQKLQCFLRRLWLLPTRCLRLSLLLLWVSIWNFLGGDGGGGGMDAGTIK
jgi:hypothetical protein